jgi:parvulin-like peptidyl-prolyl isomerase
MSYTDKKMNHQDIKAPKGKGDRLQGTGNRKRQRILPVTCHLSSVTWIALCLCVLVVSSASAQVASHAPTVIKPASDPGTIFQPVGRTVVSVNGAVLTDRDLLREMFTIFPYARLHNGFPQGMETGIRDGAMRMMVFEELVYQEARRRNMTVPAADLARAQAEFRQQFPSPQQYQQLLQEEFNGSTKLLMAKVERSLLIDKLLKQEVTDKAAVSEAEAKAYFDQHPERFSLPESFSFQSISVVPPPNANAAQLEEARKNAASALRQAQATKSYQEFGLLAEKISEDDFRVMMGDHPPADRSKLPPAVVKALLTMQPGQVSGIIEFDSNDFTILRLKEHLPAGPPKFDSIKATLRQQLAKDKTEQLRNAFATRLSKTAKIVKA